MKIIFLILFVSIGLFANNWTSYKDMYEKRDNKLILVMIERDNCIYCSKEFKRIESDKEFKRFLSENFQLVLINQDQDFIPAELISQMTPAFYILEPSDLRLFTDPFYGLTENRKFKKYLIRVLELYKEIK